MDIEDKNLALSNIVKRCCKNDPKAQMQLYKLFANAMFNTSLRIVGDRFLAEDVMQESFLTAFEKINECKTPAYFSSWLKRIVINRSIDELRKRKIHFSSLDETMTVAEESNDIFFEDEIEQAKLIDNIRNAIELLPDGYRIVLTLKLIEDYDYDSIAKELGLAESSVRSQFARGKKKLLEIIGKIKKDKDE